MKTILFLTILTQLALPQSSKMLLLFDDGYKNAETTLYLAGQTVSGSQATRIDNFITMLKDSLGITALSSKFDVMYLLANESATLGLRNLVKRSHDATAVNSPTFIQWEGFAGNGTTSYINTNYNPFTEGVVFTQNSASLSIYRRTMNSVSTSLIGATQAGVAASIIYNHTPITTTYYNLNTTTDINYLSSPTAPSMLTTSRTGASSVAFYTNSTLLVSSSSNNSTGIPNGNIFISAENLIGTGARRFSTAQLSFAMMGMGLTSTEVGKLTNCVEWYMDALNKGVIP